MMKTLTRLIVIAMQLILGFQLFTMVGGDATDCLPDEDCEQHLLVRRSSEQSSNDGTSTAAIFLFIGGPFCYCLVIGIAIGCCCKSRRKKQETIIVQSNNAQSQSQANQNQTIIVNTPPAPNYQAPLQPMGPGYAPQPAPQQAPYPAHGPAPQPEPAVYTVPQPAVYTVPQPAVYTVPQPAGHTAPQLAPQHTNYNETVLPPPRYEG